MRGNSLINNFPFPTSPVARWRRVLVELLRQGACRSDTRREHRCSQRFIDQYRTAPQGHRAVGRIRRFTHAVDRRCLYGRSGWHDQREWRLPFPELPQGFVQGLTYLGPSPSNGPPISIQKAGGLRLRSSAALKCRPGPALTVTANYSAPQASRERAAGTEPLIDGITKTDAGSHDHLDRAGDSPVGTESLLGLGQTRDHRQQLYDASDEAERFFRLQGAAKRATRDCLPAPTSPFSNAVDGAVGLSSSNYEHRGFDLLPVRLAFCILAAPGRRYSIGFTRVTPGALLFCGSKTPTRRGTRRRRSKSS